MVPRQNLERHLMVSHQKSVITVTLKKKIQKMIKQFLISITNNNMVNIKTEKVLFTVQIIF